MSGLEREISSVRRRASIVMAVSSGLGREEDQDLKCRYGCVREGESKQRAVQDLVLLDM